MEKPHKITRNNAKNPTTTTPTTFQEMRSRHYKVKPAEKKRVAVRAVPKPLLPRARQFSTCKSCRRAKLTMEGIASSNEGHPHLPEEGNKPFQRKYVSKQGEKVNRTRLKRPPNTFITFHFMILPVKSRVTGAAQPLSPNGHH